MPFLSPTSPGTMRDAWERSVNKLEGALRRVLLRPARRPSLQSWTPQRTATTSPAVSSSAPMRAVAKFFFDGERKFFVKGVTYGPFRPDAEGHFIGTPEQTRQ